MSRAVSSRTCTGRPAGNLSGDLVIALAAYNGGRGEVSRWLEEKIWDGTAANLEQVPFVETRNFVTRVLKTYRRYAGLYR